MNKTNQNNTPSSQSQSQYSCASPTLCKCAIPNCVHIYDNIFALEEWGNQYVYDRVNDVNSQRSNQLFPFPQSTNFYCCYNNIPQEYARITSNETNNGLYEYCNPDLDLANYRNIVDESNLKTINRLNTRDCLQGTDYNVINNRLKNANIDTLAKNYADLIESKESTVKFPTFNGRPNSLFDNGDCEINEIKRNKHNNNRMFNNVTKKMYSTPDYRNCILQYKKCVSQR